MSTTPRDRDICSQGNIALSRTYPFALLPLPLTMFLEFLLEFFHGICFVRIVFLTSSSEFDFVVQLVSRCLFFVLTFQVVTILNSTYVRVLVSACYPDFSGCPTFDQHICLRACVGVLPWPPSL